MSSANPYDPSAAAAAAVSFPFAPPVPVPAPAPASVPYPPYSGYSYAYSPVVVPSSSSSSFPPTVSSASSLIQAIKALQQTNSAPSGLPSAAPALHSPLSPAALSLIPPSSEAPSAPILSSSLLNDLLVSIQLAKQHSVPRPSVQLHSSDPRVSSVQCYHPSPFASSSASVPASVADATSAALSAAQSLHRELIHRERLEEAERIAAQHARAEQLGKIVASITQSAIQTKSTATTAAAEQQDESAERESRRKAAADRAAARKAEAADLRAKRSEKALKALADAEAAKEKQKQMEEQINGQSKSKREELIRQANNILNSKKADDQTAHGKQKQIIQRPPQTQSRSQAASNAFDSDEEEYLRRLPAGYNPNAPIKADALQRRLQSAMGKQTNGSAKMKSIKAAVKKSFAVAIRAKDESNRASKHAAESGAKLSSQRAMPAAATSSAVSNRPPSSSLVKRPHPPADESPLTKKIKQQLERSNGGRVSLNPTKLTDRTQTKRFITFDQPNNGAKRNNQP